MDTGAWLAIFAIMENNLGVLLRGDRGELICNGISLSMLVPSMSIKDRTIVGASVEIERMPLT